MRQKLLIVLLLLCGMASAQTHFGALERDNTWTGKQTIQKLAPGLYIVATLPTPSEGLVAIVTDGTVGGECTTGGAAQLSWCIYHSGLWQPLGAGSGGTVNLTDGSTIPSAISPSNIHAPVKSWATTTSNLNPDHFNAAWFQNYQSGNGANNDDDGRTQVNALEASTYGAGAGQHSAGYFVSQGLGDGDNFGVNIFGYGNGNCPDSGGECYGGLRVQTNPTPVFTAAVTSSSVGGGILTVNYGTIANENNRGQNRWLIDVTKAYSTGSITSITGSGTLTVLGSGTSWQTQFGAAAQVCFRIAADDNQGFKFVLPATVTDNTHLAITYQVNKQNSPYPTPNTSGAYATYPCWQATDVAAVGTLKATATALTPTNGDSIEMPLGYQQHTQAVVVSGNRVVPDSAAFPSALLWLPSGGRPWQGVWFTGGPLWNGMRFDNTWSSDDAGVNASRAIYLSHSPNYFVYNGDTANPTIIYGQSTSGNTQFFGFNPTTNIWDFRSGGAANITLNSGNGNIVTTGSVQSAGITSSTADFNLSGSGVADTSAARVFTVSNSLFLQAGSGNIIYFRNTTGTAVAQYNTSSLAFGLAGTGGLFTWNGDTGLWRPNAKTLAIGGAAINDYSGSLALNKTTFVGATSGQASIAAADVANSPSTIVLPTADPTVGQVLTASAPSGGKMQAAWITHANSGDFSYNLENPGTGDSGRYQHHFYNQATLQRIYCDTDLGTASINIETRIESTPNVNGATVLAVPLVCTTTGASTTTFVSANTNANTIFALAISAVSGSPGIVRVHVAAVPR